MLKYYKFKNIFYKQTGDTYKTGKKTQTVKNNK